MSSKIVPNTFQSPNILVDDFMRYLTGDEIKCYLVVVRKTFGWQKNKDRIAMSVFSEITGLSPDTVSECMKSLVSYGLIIRVAENNPEKNIGIQWALQMDDSKIGAALLQERYAKRLEKAKIWGEKMRQKKAEKAGLSQDPTPLSKDHPTPLIKASQKPLSTATKEQDRAQFFDEANRKVSAMIDLERKAATSWPGRDKLPPAICDLADEFITLTAIKPSKKELSYWLGEISDWLSFGVTKPDVKAGIDYAKAHDYAIMSPGSLTKTVRMLAAKRHQPAQEPAYVY